MTAASERAVRPGFVITCGVYAVHLALPGIALMMAFGPATAVLFPLVLYLAWELLVTRGWRERAPRVLRWGYAVTELAVAFLVVIWFIRPFEPVWVGIAGWACAAFLVVHLVRSRWLDLAYWGGYWGFLGYLLWNVHSTSVLVLYALGAVVLCREFLLRPRWRELFAVGTLVVPVAVLPVAAAGLVLQRGYVASWIERVEAQPGVTSLMAVGRPSWPPELARRLRFVTEGCSPDILIMGAQGDKREYSLMRWNRATGEQTYAKHVMGGSENVLVDCEGGRFLVGSLDTNEILEYGLGAVTRSGSVYDLPDLRPIQLLWSADRRVVLLAGEDTARVVRVDLGSGSVDTIEDLPRSTCRFDGDGEFWVAWGGFAGGALRGRAVPYSLGTSASPVRELGGGRVGMQTPVHCEYDPRRGRLYFAEMRAGRLVSVALDDSTPPRAVQLGRGVWHLSRDPSGQVLAVTNYLTGIVDVVDAETLDGKAQFYVGPRAGKPVFSGYRADRLLVFSAIGLFEIDLAAVRSGRPG
ncbi:MAG: hypothetical protein HYY13_09760 [Nitrospirae bacterium]|nr:hypothetical protein [Nitrospirota bacterium]